MRTGWVNQLICTYKNFTLFPKKKKKLGKVIAGIGTH